MRRFEWLVHFLLFNYAISSSVDFAVAGPGEDNAISDESSSESSNESIGELFEPVKQVNSAFDWNSFPWIQLFPGHSCLQRIRFEDDKAGRIQALFFIVNAVVDRWKDFRAHEELLHAIGANIYALYAKKGQNKFKKIVRKNVESKSDRRVRVLCLFARHAILEIGLQNMNVLDIEQAYSIVHDNDFIPIDEDIRPKLSDYFETHPEDIVKVFPIISTVNVEFLLESNYNFEAVKPCKLLDSLQQIFLKMPQEFFERPNTQSILVALCLEQVENTKLMTMAYYRGLSALEPEIKTECSESLQCAVLGPFRESVVDDLDAEFFLAYGRKLIKIDPSLIDWFAAKAVENTEIRQALLKARKLSFFHRPLLTVVFTGQLDFDTFFRNCRNLNHLRKIAVTRGSFKELEYYCARADDVRFSKMIKAFIKADRPAAEIQSLALLFLKRAEQSKVKRFGKLKLVHKWNVHLLTKMILPRLLALPLRLLISGRVFIRAVRTDEYFEAIKENPRVLKFVALKTIKFADLLLLSPERLSELRTLHPIFEFDR